jgi:hypothetical protein
LIDKICFQKLAKSMEIITKKIKSVVNRPAYIVQILLLLSKRPLCISISWENSFHFMTQKQGRTGQISRWEKSHGALRQSGAPTIMTFFLDQHNFLFGRQQLPFIILI